jgi:Tol biopolymer transport system component
MRRTACLLVDICAGAVLFSFPVAAAGPLPLPPGTVELEELRELGEVGAVGRSFEYGRLAYVYFTLPTEDGYGLFRSPPLVGPPELVYSSPELVPGVLAVSRDGRRAVIGLREEGRTRLHLLELESYWDTPPRPVPLADGAGDESAPCFSPDGKGVAFLVSRGGRTKLHWVQLEKREWGEGFLSRLLSEEGRPLLPWEGEERGPALGPLGLAFLSDVLGSWDLWVLTGRGLSQPRLVLPGVVPDSPLAWVGRRIFVVRNGQPGLVSLDGGFFRPLSGPAGWWRAPGGPDFPVLSGTLYRAEFPQPPSPDFAYFRTGERYPELWLGTLDGTAWKVADSVPAGDVAWSSDGSQLAYIRCLPGQPTDMKEAGFCPEHYELWVARADGTEPQLVDYFPSHGGLWCLDEIGWSRDGGRIYFGVAGSPTHQEIWSIRPDGTGLAYHTWGWDLVFHRDGRISGITRGGIPFLYDPETDDKLLFEEWGMISRAFFSPDASRFLAEVAGALVLIDWREGTERPLLPISQAKPRDRWAPLQISWRPDGAGFAFASGWDGDDEIFYYDLAGGELRKLTDNWWDDRLPVVSPDGEYLAYVARGGEPGIRILPWTGGEELRVPGELPERGSAFIWRPQEGR